MRRGRLALDRTGGLREALVAFGEATHLEPSSSTPLLGQLEAFDRLQRYSEADALCERLTIEFPDDLDVLAAVAWFHVERRDVRARGELDAVLERDPAHVAALNTLGTLHFNDRRYERAEDCYRKVIEVAPAEPNGYSNLAWVVRQERRVAESEEFARRSIQLDAKNANAHHCLGVIAFNHGDLREAERHLLRSIEIDPRQGAQRDLGALYVQLDRYEEAERLLRIAIDIDANDTRARIELGGLHLAQEENADAVREFRQAAAFEPDNADAVHALAVGLWRAGKLLEAEKVIRVGMRRVDESGRWRLHLAMSKILTQRGDETHEQRFYEEALAETNKAIVLGGGEPEPHFQSGVLRAKLGDYWRAWRNFEHCRARDPEYVEAERYAEMLQRQLFRGALRSSHVGGVALGVVSIGQLVTVWVLYLANRIPDTVFATVVPVSLGLLVVAFVLPWLTHLKMPGFEAEVSVRHEQVSEGPTGLGASAASVISASASLAPMISQGPS